MTKLIPSYANEPEAKTFDIIQWMADHGHPGYALEIARAKSPEEIAEIRQAAQDRYDDWASDPLD